MGLAKRIIEEEEANRARGFRIPPLGQKYVCPAHFSNRFIRQHILSHSAPGQCSYCERITRVTDLANLIEYLGTRLTSHLGPIEDQALYLSSSFLDKDDDDDSIPGFHDVDGLLAPKGEEIYDDYEHVAYDFGCLAVDGPVPGAGDALDEDIAEHFYVDRWIRRDPVSLHPHETWKYGWQDFFNTVIKTFQDTGLRPQNSYDTDNLLDACPEISADGFKISVKALLAICCDTASLLITEIPPATEVWRGRPDWNGTFYSNFTDITSPPATAAKANRLSKTGESYFYGSLDSTTPIAEIYNYCTGTLPDISLGKFATLKPLKVIDFTNIPTPDFWAGDRQWQGCLFLKPFHEEITKAVDDQNDHIEYVPTQIFIDYLRRFFPDLDGVAYRSSKTGLTNACFFCDNSTSATMLTLVSATNVPKPSPSTAP